LFLIRDINWPRHCVCADVGGTSTHVPHSRGRLIPQLLNWFKFGGRIGGGWGGLDNGNGVNISFIFFCDQGCCFVWTECFRLVTTNLLLLGFVVFANAIFLFGGTLALVFLCFHLPRKMIQFLAFSHFLFQKMLHCDFACEGFCKHGMHIHQCLKKSSKLQNYSLLQLLCMCDRTMIIHAC